MAASCSSRNDTWSWTSLASITWKSSSTSTMSAPTEPSSLARVVTTVSMGGGWGPSIIEIVAAARWHRSVERCGHAEPEGAGLVVGRVEGHPDRDQVVRGGGRQPVGKQRGLAEPGRGGDERHLGTRRSTQSLRQPGPGHRGLARTRDVELRIGEDAGHASGYRALPRALTVLTACGAGQANTDAAIVFNSGLVDLLRRNGGHSSRAAAQKPPIPFGSRLLLALGVGRPCQRRDPLAEDQAALETSRQRILATADRVVPGHGEPFEAGRSS